MKIRSPAKINLYLEITGKRPDGYHELVTLMCPIGLCDILEVSFEAVPSETPGIRVTCDHPDVPDGPANIAHAAAARFFEAAGRSGNGLSVRIRKNIPAGAGLGGGSSNAAAVLRVLNEHFGRPLSPARLHEIAVSTGADVPFFLLGKPALATGIGDILEPFPRLPSYPIILIYPGQALATRDVYKNLKLGLTKSEKMPKKSIFKPDRDTDVERLLYNALEPPAFELCPPAGTAKAGLIETGAAGALLSGSGSTVFGIYKDEKTASEAFHRLAGKPGAEPGSALDETGNPGWRVFYTRMLV